MAYSMKPADGMLTLAEIKEFASFPAAAQRYVRRSLDVAYHRADAVALWSRDVVESAGIKAQSHVYERLPELRQVIPGDSGIDTVDVFMGGLVALSAFDLGQNRLSNFGAYRFLYERLLGANARPWLPAAFCAAAALPHLHPSRRRSLLQSISEAAATAPGWSTREPVFFPEWVEKDEIPLY
jgi:hypothetical protein